MNSFAQDLRNNATEPERVLWNRLRRRQLNGFKFRRQHPIGRYVCDFVCLEASVIVEFDGSQHVIDAPVRRQSRCVPEIERLSRPSLLERRRLSQTDSVVETIFEALYRPEMEGRFD